MILIKVPDGDVAEILRDNGLNPKEYGLCHVSETGIRLLCYKTRDTIVIHQGDKPWKDRQNEREDEKSVLTGRLAGNGLDRSETYGF